MPEKQYLLVEESVLPEVFLRVLHAKELLAGGEAKNVSRATGMAGVSRSAYYKYRDSVFRSEAQRPVVTLKATLRDETGALQGLLAALSAAGAGVVTIHQSMPEDGTARVAVTVRTENMATPLNALCEQLAAQQAVVDIQLSK